MIYQKLTEVPKENEWSSGASSRGRYVIVVDNNRVMRLNAGDGNPAAMLWGLVGNENVHLYGLASPLDDDEAVNKAYVDAKVPDTTTSDNNKFLRVVNGVPTWIALTNVAEEGV